MSKETQVKGSCACGHITYLCSTLPTHATDCHCLECRKISGGPYITFVSFPQSSVTFSQSPKTVRLSTVAERAFCDQCGSTIWMRYFMHPEDLYIAAGSINEDSLRDEKWVAGLERSRIFMEDKAGWYKVPDDGVPGFERFGAGFDDELNEWKKRA